MTFHSMQSIEINSILLMKLIWGGGAQWDAGHSRTKRFLKFFRNKEKEKN